ncbi:MAG TPA: hypothetical protein PLU30_24605 [Verrucomicrobiae bacterium]|nr:hypothetical protein [Verrucomicrobiae bacterium]
MPLAQAFALLAATAFANPGLTNAGPTYAQRDWLDSLPDEEPAEDNGDG